ncbi:MAG: DUF3828 domain-containing protein [bacterium]|nr:DUF3828 domain-containing protein [bacterium]
MLSRRALILSGAAVLMAVVLPPEAQAADDPADVVTAIYTRAAKGNGDSGGNFVIENKAAKAKYLSKGLNALWARADARTKKGDVGPVDFDPVTNSQDPDVKSFKVTAEKQEAEKATIAATLESHGSPPAKATDKTIRYDFVRENSQWRIDDFRGAVDGKPWSIRAILTGALR